MFPFTSTEINALAVFWRPAPLSCGSCSSLGWSRYPPTVKIHVRRPQCCRQAVKLTDSAILPMFLETCSSLYTAAHGRLVRDWPAAARWDGLGV